MCALKILGGQARGRSIYSLPGTDLSVRPILGRIKKSLFDIIQPRLAGSVFLDLFAGTGAVGLEALSRGAKKAIFVELEQKSVSLIKKNLEVLGWGSISEILNCDATKDLGSVREKFDIIFLGPPYKDDKKAPLALTGITLKNILASGILVDGGIIIGQHHIKEPVEIPEGLEQFRIEKYGDTVLSFYRKVV